MPAITDNFWEVVAEKMSSGHTAEDCGNEYFRMKGGRRGRRAATHDAGKQKEPAEKGLSVGQWCSETSEK